MSNDRFKFRIWKPNAKELCYSDKFSIDATVTIWWNVCGEYEPYAKAEPGVVDMCTGLRDKNGVLIYEGDILKTIFNPFKTEVRAVVYGELSARWKLGERSCVALNIENAEESEIVGNIHENPEILECKK